MAIPPFLPPGAPWLFDAVCGQSWPAGDEDALHRCAQHWDDALHSVVDLAADGTETSLGVLSKVAAMSAEDFAKYWSQYTSLDLDHTALGQLAKQCLSMVSALDGQANEVEYTKLVIDITIVATAIQIAWAIAAALPTMGASLAEVPLLTFIARWTVQGFFFRFVQMVLMMVLPDLIAQGWMLHAGDEYSWDGSKTKGAAENAIVGGVLGSVLGGAAAKWVPFMGEDFGKTVGQKILQGAGHFAEGGLTMDLTTLATIGINLGWAEHNGDKQAVQQVEQQFSQTNWLGQFAQGGLLSTAFYLPSVGDSHGAPMSFTGDDGQTYTVKLSDKTMRQLQQDGTFPDGFKTQVYDKGGRLVGNATFDGPDVTVTGPGTKPVHAGLAGDPGGGGGFQVVHDGAVQHYGYPPSDQGPSPDGASGAPGPDESRPTARMLSYTKPSDGPVTYQVTSAGPDGTVTTDTMTGAKGSVLHYTPGPDGQVFRADLMDPDGGGYTSVLGSGNNDSAPAYQVTGRAEFNYGPLGVGHVVGLHGITHYAADATTVLGTTNALTGRFTPARADATASTTIASIADASPLRTPGSHDPGLTASAPPEADPALGPSQPSQAGSSGQGEEGTVGVVGLIDPNTLAVIAAQQAFQATGDQQVAVMGGHGGDPSEQPGVPPPPVTPLPEVPGAVRGQDVAGRPASWGKALVFTDTGEAMKYAGRAWRPPSTGSRQSSAPPSRPLPARRSRAATR